MEDIALERLNVGLINDKDIVDYISNLYSLHNNKLTKIVEPVDKNVYLSVKLTYDNLTNTIRVFSKQYEVYVGSFSGIYKDKISAVKAAKQFFSIAFSGVLR